MGRCEGWEQHNLSLEQEVEMDNNVNQIAEDIPDENTDNQTGVELDDLFLDQWVAILYEGQWYIEKIQDIDRQNSDIYLTFLENLKTRGKDSELKFRWPKNVDELWVKPENILCTIEKPKPFGSHERFMLISRQDFDCITQIMSDRS